MSSSKVNMIQGHYNIYIIKDVRGRAQHPGQQKNLNALFVYLCHALNLPVLALKFCVIARHFRVRMRDINISTVFYFFFQKGRKWEGERTDPITQEKMCVDGLEKKKWAPPSIFLVFGVVTAGRWGGGYGRKLGSRDEKVVHHVSEISRGRPRFSLFI